MAFLKTKELDNGFSGNYWKIMNINQNFGDNSIHIQISLFKDSAARFEDKMPISQYNYDFSGDENPCTIANMDNVDSNPVKLIYLKLKTLEDFSDAENC